MKKEFLEKAEPYYSSELPYHNFEHVKNTLDAAEEIIDRCKKHEVSINPKIVFAALAFHDALYHRDEEKEGFETKEDLAKHIAEKELKEMNVEKTFIKKVKKCIEATKHESEPKTNNQVLVRAADLRGLMGDYKEFKKNTEALKKESKKITGQKPDQEEWLQNVLETLLHYGVQDLELTPEHDNKKDLSEFHTRLGRNIGQFLHDYFKSDYNIKIDVEKRE